MKVAVAFLLALIFIAGAGSTGRSAAAQEDDYQFKLVKPLNSKGTTYEDPRIKIVFSPDEHQIKFTIRNKTAGPLNLDWNHLSFVDTEGKAHRVIHNGVRLMERDKEMPTTVVPPGASVDDLIVPSDFISWESSKSSRWEQKPILPAAHGFRSLKLNGATFSVFFPMQVSGVTKDYNFVFVIGAPKRPPSGSGPIPIALIECKATSTGGVTYSELSFSNQDPDSRNTWSIEWDLTISDPELAGSPPVILSADAVRVTNPSKVGVAKYRFNNYMGLQGKKVRARVRRVVFSGSGTNDWVPMEDQAGAVSCDCHP
jgi:hypothetical protein